MAQDKIQPQLNVIIRAINNGKRNYEHDGKNISVLVSKEDHEFLMETRKTIDVDILMKRYVILSNALQKTNIDTSVYCVEALIPGR